MGGAARRGGAGADPVAALMFRFNDPDALLVLLLILGAYGAIRAQQNTSIRWRLLTAACAGTGFLAEMLQAFLVVPVFAPVYLVTAPPPVRRRLRQLAAAGGALVAAARWWATAVALVPASSRPYIGGSQHDSVLELALGCNGIGRLCPNASAAAASSLIRVPAPTCKGKRSCPGPPGISGRDGRWRVAAFVVDHRFL
ncbi:glycosyltransferase family 39 protein [Actinomadura sp. 9N215]|uniref:glycosyltransferase family 39 protein n=1 Tax=Actinomadura sp. 9N215 TaxID=3375150 RepID=UPI0037B2AD10